MMAQHRRLHKLIVVWLASQTPGRSTFFQTVLTLCDFLPSGFAPWRHLYRNEVESPVEREGRKEGWRRGERVTEHKKQREGERERAWDRQKERENVLEFNLGVGCLELWLRVSVYRTNRPSHELAWTDCPRTLSCNTTRLSLEETIDFFPRRFTPSHQRSPMSDSISTYCRSGREQVQRVGDASAPGQSSLSQTLSFSITLTRSTHLKQLFITSLKATFWKRWARRWATLAPKRLSSQS